MKRLIHIALLGMLASCNSEDLKKIVEDEKLHKDSEAVVEDLVEVGEDLLKDELGIDLQKGKENAPD